MDTLTLWLIATVVNYLVVGILLTIYIAIKDRKNFGECKIIVIITNIFKIIFLWFPLLIVEANI